MESENGGRGEGGGVCVKRRGMKTGGGEAAVGVVEGDGVAVGVAVKLMCVL